MKMSASASFRLVRLISYSRFRKCSDLNLIGKYLTTQRKES